MKTWEFAKEIYRCPVRMMLVKRQMAAAIFGLGFATTAIADPALPPALPAVAQIISTADPQKGFEVKPGKDVKLSSAEPSRLRVLPGLKDKSYISLEAVGHTGWFLHHQKFVVYLHQHPKTTNGVWEGDVSFKLIHLDGDKVRFEPSTWPGFFITAKSDGSVIIARNPPLEESTFILKEAKD